jgi:hypothetical protein
MGAQDVAPELHRAAVRQQRLDDAAKVLEVHRGDADLVGAGPADAAPELEGLVAPDVDPPAAQRRHLLAHEADDEVGVVRGGSEHGGIQPHPGHELDAVGALGAVPVGRVGEPRREVPEAVLVRDQLDAHGRAAPVEPDEVVGGER